jgi:hypothetical protein
MATETMARTDTATISARSRNLGYGWRTDAESTPRGLRIRDIAAPQVEGGLASVEREMAYRHRVCGPGGYYREALFVGGRRVTAIHDLLFTPDAAYDGDDYYEHGTWAEGWAALGQPALTVGTVVQRLRDGDELTVRLEG